MSAEIIQFNKARTSTNKRDPQYDTPVHRRIRANLERIRKIEKEAVAVRCTVDGKLYEVHFHGANVWRVCSVYPRRQHGRMIEVVRRCTDNQRVIAAAWRARSQTKPEVAPNFSREVSLAQLLARHARLLLEAEKVKALIALVERELS